MKMLLNLSHPRSTLRAPVRASSGGNARQAGFPAEANRPPDQFDRSNVKFGMVCPVCTWMAGMMLLKAGAGAAAAVAALKTASKLNVTQVFDNSGTALHQRLTEIAKDNPALIENFTKNPKRYSEELMREIAKNNPQLSPEILRAEIERFKSSHRQKQR